MLSRWNQNSRLCVLEASNKTFHDSMSKHMQKEEQAFRELNVSIKDIITHIDTAQKENASAIIQAQKENHSAIQYMKEEVLETMDREFVGKLQVEKDLTGLRKSMEAKFERILEKRDEEMEKDQQRSTSDLVILGTVVTAAVGATVTLCLWFYNNVQLIQPVS